jgi:hypothetical protein
MRANKARSAEAFEQIAQSANQHSYYCAPAQHPPRLGRQRRPECISASRPLP